MKKIIIPMATLSVTAMLYLVWFSAKKSSFQYVELTITEEIKALDNEKLEEDLGLDLLDDEELTLIDIDRVLTADNRMEVIEEDVPRIEEASMIIFEDDMEEVKKRVSPKKGIPPLFAIRIDNNVLSKLNIGDTLVLPFMGLDEYEATIEDKVIHPNGSVSVSGNLVDSDQYSIVFTQGETSLYGTVVTPTGSFEIETKNGYGYIYNTANIDSRWIDYQKSDTLNPRHE